jgi:hypothetical protein
MKGYVAAALSVARMGHVPSVFDNEGRHVICAHGLAPVSPDAAYSQYSGGCSVSA